MNGEASTIRLPTGDLEYRGDPGNATSLGSLCDFGARRNPKRGFVFVSKVLGKHWPAEPSAMADLQAQLASQIPVDGRGAILFVGLAETATGLGHGVFEAFLERHAGPALFLQTTRYPLDGAQPIAFEEEHSHATQQFLYLPEDPRRRALMADVTVAVLVDDEASSGTTFVNLARVLRDACPRLASVHPVMLTDFTGGVLETRLRQVPGIERADAIALWKGSYHFHRDPLFREEPAEPAFARVDCRRSHISGFTGRLGLTGPIALPAALVERCWALVGDGDVLVVGTGECMHPAFRLALALEGRGRRVFVQSTTRSPLMLAGAIQDVRRVTDVYGEDIPNYLYNTSRSPGARIVLVHESRDRERVDRLVRELDAVEVSLADCSVRPAPRSGDR